MKLDQLSDSALVKIKDDALSRLLILMAGCCAREVIDGSRNKEDAKTVARSANRSQCGSYISVLRTRMFKCYTHGVIIPQFPSFFTLAIKAFL